MKSNTMYPPAFVLPAKAFSAIPKRGMELVNLKSLGIIPGIGGGSRGYNAAGDIITQTQDAVPINELWKAYQDMLAEFNARRDPLLNFLTWRTTRAREDLIGAGSQTDFEEASEYGEPVGIRSDLPPTSSLGYTFKWYDLAARFTWMFLADADSQQVDAIANLAGEADNRLVFNTVLRTLFNTNRRANKEGQVVYPFYSGIAGDQPPAVGTTTFADSHQHFVTSGGAVLTPANLEAMQALVTEHGYKRVTGYSLILMVNEAQEGVIRNFRSTANGGAGTYDFIPAQGTIPLLLPVDLQLSAGVSRPPATLNGMEVIGSYADMTIVKSEFIPAGYMTLFATGGAENIQNPIAIREHPQSALQGLRLVIGRAHV